MKQIDKKYRNKINFARKLLILENMNVPSNSLCSHMTTKPIIGKVEN